MLIGWLVWVLDGFMVDHNSESSLVVVVNAKQYLDQSLMHLKKNWFLAILVNHSPWGDGTLRY